MLRRKEGVPVTKDRAPVEQGKLVPSVTVVHVGAMTDYKEAVPLQRCGAQHCLAAKPCTDGGPSQGRTHTHSCRLQALLSTHLLKPTTTSRLGIGSKDDALLPSSSPPPSPRALSSPMPPPCMLT